MIHISYKKIIVLALVVGSLASFSSGTTVSASTFNPGRIIDDGVFTDKSTMNPSQIQDFLNAKVPRCDTWGEQPYAGTTRAQYAASRGVSTPFTCLKDYTQDGKRASQIIYDVAQKYSINPQVLIVLLQKEQGLITDDWPWPIQYRSATGYGCPDTADCSAQYYGFTNQVDWAARMFRAILNDSPDWYTPYELGNNFIQYSPDASCGGSTVNVQNRSTQALYNYTPYQPNQAALDAGWGTAPCGAYGNRNFHLYFTSWFGDTFVQFNPLDTSRWMQIATTTKKKNPWTNEDRGADLIPGNQLKFIDKIFVNGEWYLRTAYDSQYNLPQGIPLGAITEIPVQSFETPRYMQLNSERIKWDPVTTVVDSSQTFNKGSSMKFVDKVIVNGAAYYRTAYDSSRGNRLFITASGTQELTYTPFETPRYMKLKVTAEKTNPVTESSTGITYQSDQQVKFVSKILIGQEWFYRSEEDNNSNLPYAIPASSVTDVSYRSYGSHPEWLVASADTIKRHPASGVQEDNVAVTVGQHVLIAEKITINDVTYYRTEYDRLHKNDKAVPASNFQVIAFTPMEEPRYMRTKKQTAKYNPRTDQYIAGLESGVKLRFVEKITVNNQLYLRTEYDTVNNLVKAIPVSALENVQ